MKCLLGNCNCFVSVTALDKMLMFWQGLTGQQIRSKIGSFQNANFLISRRDDFNEGHIIGFSWEMRKLSWKPFCLLFLNCSPGVSSKRFHMSYSSVIPTFHIQELIFHFRIYNQPFQFCTVQHFDLTIYNKLCCEVPDKRLSCSHNKYPDQIAPNESLRFGSELF